MKLVSLKRQDSRYGSVKTQPVIEAWLADTYFSRLRGLLGRKQLGENDGLLLERCASVHTFGMRYPLDLVFLDKEGKVMKCQEGVKPYRTASARGAYYTLELNQGVISKQGISENDHFYW
jgi:uncharacterized membrane protein (UPF0127 family)